MHAIGGTTAITAIGMSSGDSWQLAGDASVAKLASMGVTGVGTEEARAEGVVLACFVGMLASSVATESDAQINAHGLPRLYHSLMSLHGQDLHGTIHHDPHFLSSDQLPTLNLTTFHQHLSPLGSHSRTS